MIKIMFVCHGNICRSPMAEILFKHIANSKGLQNEFTVSSSATSYEEIGNPIYPPAKRILKENGIPFDEHYAVKLKSEDYDKYDLFIVMDENNLFNIRRIFPADPKNKIRKLLSFDGTNADVSDPYYSGDFNRTYKDILRGVTALTEYFTKRM
ncbi:MAG: low molecular weight phosphotyrosine protein phosphatase [Clostridia bacterium]|nr:low molecular weight phosphotyrosine protein phosphatase [Clostridia bacterium]